MVDRVVCHACAAREREERRLQSSETASTDGVLLSVSFEEEADDG